MMTNLLNGAHVANKLFSTIARLRLLLVMFVTLTVSANVWGAEETATLSFASTAQRDSQTTTKQVWSNAGITFTNNKASSTTNVANYSNPVRLYANSEVIVEHTSGKMTKIVFDCNGNYASAMNTSIGTVSGATVSVSSDKVTVTFTPAVASFTVAKLSEQIRLDAITVTYTSGGGSTPDPTTHTIKWHTAKGVTTDVILNEGADITKPATDPKMTGYEFMGWTEDCEVASDGDGFTAITNFGTATEDKDYYAVFAEPTPTGGGGGSTEGSKTLVSSSSSSYYQSGFITGVAGTNSASWTADAFTMVQNKNSSKDAVALNYAEIRVYASHSIVFTPSTGSTITSIVATATSSSYATALGGSSINNCTKSVTNSTVTITPKDGTEAVTLTNTAQSRLKTIVVNYTTSGGGGSTTYSDYRTTCATQMSR